ncbi:MAG: hypothetical protein R3222_03485 [Balneolaceae bacterium]|nr:hypothetical protein [Balneolaceae bacterium]
MAEILELSKEWFFGLGAKYGVNPIIFGAIYVGAIPLFTASMAWLYRNYRRERSIVLPAVSAILFFISAYIYLIIAGNNVPWWVYAVMVVMVSYGVFATTRKIRKKIKKIDHQISLDE